jgi:ligand-binding sensor domain-containing protein
VEVDNGVIVQKYDTTNSELYPIAENSGEIRVSAVAFDKDAKLWAVSTSATRPVAMRKPDGTWKSYGFNSAINDQSTSDMLIDSSGQKWFIVQDRGLVVFKTDEEDELESFQLINDQIGSGALNSTRVFSMAQDLDGLIWVGTSKGVNVIYSPDAILDENNQSNWDAQKITVSQGGFNQYLLNSEEVTAIVVDGANRKWFGTKSAGLFLVSPDGTEQIANYDFENSPLLSNTIISMAMNYKTGELFIGTDQGICSFRTDASMSDRGFDKMYAFPNPVRPDYTGLITVTGLVNNADVKITDVEGNVVFAGVSNGGTITWNGRLYSGERAATGVYMIFAANEDGSETKVTKLLFVN